MSLFIDRLARATATSFCGAAFLVGCGGGSSSQMEQPFARGKSPVHQIEVLSSEPSLISGGNALVRVTLPPGTVKNGVQILAAGADMTTHFKEVRAGPARLNTQRPEISGLAAV